jgi:MFS family permease
MFWVQFLGAFNDNVFKNALVVLITFRSFQLGQLGTEQMVALCGGVFILPFFLFSSLAGQISDRFSKNQVAKQIKLLEIVIMVLGTIGFFGEHIPLLLFTLFLMGTQSAFFGPVKYSILPDYLEEQEIVRATAWTQMGTFLSILLGTIYGGIVIALPGSGVPLISVSVIVLALVGYLASFYMLPLPDARNSARIDWNILRSTWQITKLVYRDRLVFTAIMAISWYWFYGAALLSIFPVYAKEVLLSNEQVVTLFLAQFSVGVGIGSFICEKLSKNKMNLRLSCLGGLGLSLFAFDLYFVGLPELVGVSYDQLGGVREFFQQSASVRILFDLLGLSISGGFFIVPLYSLIQLKTEQAQRSRVIGGNNILNALMMVGSAVVLMIFYQIGLDLGQIFGAISLINILVLITLLVYNRDFRGHILHP